jgi:hypothetical protein
MNTGGILDEPSVEAIGCVRQIAYTFKKIRLACTEHRVRAALDQFKKIELDFDEPLHQEDLTYFAKVSHCLWGAVFANEGFNPLTAVPRHGPGATADRLAGNRKWLFGSWHERLDPYFPYYHFAFSSESAIGCKADQDVTLKDGAEEQPVRVVFVPKTLKSPRVIAIEPVCMQYTQQAVSDWLIRQLESVSPTKGHINFTDQSVNRSIALRSSKSGEFATLDLSAASDRVPLSASMLMFDTVPDLQGAIFACRSRRALLPDDSVIHLRKFASMGSALCFPVEAMYFYTICVAARLEIHNLPVTFTNIKKVGEGVFVYGDDIIVPADEAEAVSAALHKYYCKVGMDKSFWLGKFRESCGMDAFDGEDLTPTYVRHLPPTNRRDSSALISWVATSNLLYLRGYWKTAELMKQSVQTILGALPTVSSDCAGLGWISYQGYDVTQKMRYNARYQVDEVNTWIPAPIKQKCRIGDYPALNKCLQALCKKSTNILDVLFEGLSYSPREGKISSYECVSEHLKRSARHGAVALKRRWTRPGLPGRMRSD